MNLRTTLVLFGATIGCRPAGAPPAAACLQIDSPAAPIGFDAPFSIAARWTCPEVRDAEITWRQIDGVPLGALTVQSKGFRLSARTPPLRELFGATPPWGIVPFSPRTRGQAMLEATWQGGRGRGHTFRRLVVVAAADRSRGLPNTAVGAGIHLGGGGWRVITRPAGSVATLAAGRETTTLVPDVAGDWRLADARGTTLGLRTGRYDETPLDCGRAGCHAAITTAVATSPMTTVLARGLSPMPTGAAAFGAGYPECAIACHATGDTALADGGFAHVALELGMPAHSATGWDDLPRALRRLGGVGCLACHGPGALPEPAARWSVLRADVCATCHDAPPRYGHVAAWRTTAMARADRDPRAGTERACVGCHTTWGFLEALGTNEPGRAVQRHPPADVGPIGISCAACHAAHDHTRVAPAANNATPTRLLRTPPTPAVLADVAPPAGSAVCLPCHTPDPSAGVPFASSGAIWLGRGGVDPKSGRPLAGPAPHAQVAGGCTGCHRSTSEPSKGSEPPAMGYGGEAASALRDPGRDQPEQPGSNHGFAASAATCTPCHPQPPPTSDLVHRARRLWAQSGGADLNPAHAAHDDKRAADRRTPRGRALWNVRLVLEDRGAAAHNAPYARALLAAAESVLR